MKFFKNKKAFALILGGSTALLVIALALANTFSSLQSLLSDVLYSSRKTNDQITVVTIDNQTLSDDQGLGNYEKWQRNYFAKVLDNINKYNPKIVGFDIFFKSKKDPAADEQFKESLEKTKNPVIVYMGSATSYNPRGYYVQLEKYTPLELPLELFRTLENINISMPRVLADGDNVIRKMLPILMNEDGSYYENLSFTIARIALGAKEKPLHPLVTPSKYQIQLKNGQNINIPLQDGQMLINYASKLNESAFRSVSFINVYNEKYPQDPEKLFKDKIVLIGPTATYFKDSLPTPMSNKDLMAGIGIHANALQTILDQKFLRNMSPVEKSLLILLLAFSAAFVFMFTKIRYSLAFLLGVPLLYSLAAKPLFNMGVIADLVHPYLTIALTFISIYLYRYLTEFKAKLALQSAFGKYVNPTLVKQISENPEQLKLGGEMREITIMFTDIAHSTTLEEKLSPQSVVALLSEYFEAMSQVIMAEGGMVDKFEGDGIMALFGAPVSQPDHQARAAHAALNMRVKLAQLLTKWQQPENSKLPGGEPKPPIDFRVGLSSGEAIVGNIGSTNRFDYTAMGDVVNLSSRLEGANKKYETRIMMSQKTHDAIAPEFETRELDIIQVVGKTEPIKVYELLAPKGQLPEAAAKLLQQYNEAIDLYHARKFAEALAKFQDILKTYPQDGPSQLYRQRCEVLQNFPPKPDWNGVFEMGSK